MWKQAFTDEEGIDEKRQQCGSGDSHPTDKDKALPGNAGAEAGQETPVPKRGLTKDSSGSAVTRTSSTADPPSMSHHKVAIDVAAGPAGSSVESGPLQPAKTTVVNVTTSGVGQSLTPPMIRRCDLGGGSWDNPFLKRRVAMSVRRWL